MHEGSEILTSTMALYCKDTISAMCPDTRRLAGKINMERLMSHARLVLKRIYVLNGRMHSLTSSQPQDALRPMQHFLSASSINGT